MKNFATLKNEITDTLGSFVDSVNVSLYEDKFYIVEETKNGWKPNGGCHISEDCLAKVG